MPNKTSPHILGTATNLLGFCLIVISSLHIANKAQNSLADEFASIIAVLLTLSCILSFLSIKTINSKIEEALERIADQLFFIALFGILAIIIFLTIKLWNN
jgi:membrane protease YdiL (CAAX protease family)